MTTQSDLQATKLDFSHKLVLRLAKSGLKSRRSCPFSFLWLSARTDRMLVNAIMQFVDLVDHVTLFVGAESDIFFSLTLLIFVSRTVI